MKHEAIYNTHPSVVTIRGDNCFDADDNPVTLDQAKVDAEVARLQAEHDSTEYQRLRVPEYPSIGDQLDAILKHLNYRRTQGDELIQELDDVVGDWLSVKARYPK
jgi:hypothetical protein